MRLHIADAPWASIPLCCVILTFGLVVSGCQVPNVEPFANATLALRRAIIESGAVTAETMATVPKRSTNTKELMDLWQDRVRLMDVLLGYSDALAGVAAAGAAAQQTVQTLGDSIMSLADIVPSTGAAAREGVQLAQLLIRTGIQIKAYHDLDAAISAAHPALTEVARYLQADLDDLQRLYRNASQDREFAIDETYGKHEAQRDQLLARRDRLRDTMFGTFNDINVEQVKKIEELIAYMEPEHQEYVQQRATLLRERTLTSQMFNKAKQGIRAWVQAHEELKLAMAQKRQPNVRLILSTAQEIKDAVDRIKQR